MTTDGRRWLWYLAKLLEGVGMVLVLVGLMMSIGLGFEEEGLKAQSYEGLGLAWGGGMFILGWILERVLGTR